MDSQNRSWRVATSNVVYALSLTAVMSSTLFVLVALNPKTEAYDNLPWYYAASCLVMAAVLYRVHQRLEVIHEDPND